MECARNAERGRFIANALRSCASRRRQLRGSLSRSVGLNLRVPILLRRIRANPRIVRHSDGRAMRIYVVAKCFSTCRCRMARSSTWKPSAEPNRR